MRRVVYSQDVFDLNDIDWCDLHSFYDSIEDCLHDWVNSLLIELRSDKVIGYTVPYIPL